LREHGLVKRVNQRYRYYLTEFGRQVTLMALKLREMVIIPSLAFEIA
jgi:DNA-binding HxlR family transcriptional regulator